MVQIEIKTDQHTAYMVGKIADVALVVFAIVTTVWLVFKLLQGL